MVRWCLAIAGVFCLCLFHICTHDAPARFSRSAPLAPSPLPQPTFVVNVTQPLSVYKDFARESRKVRQGTGRVLSAFQRQRERHRAALPSVPAVHRKRSASRRAVPCLCRARVCTAAFSGPPHRRHRRAWKQTFAQQLSISFGWGGV